ncbi:MAG: DM13 domain-containing protein [Bacteroidetes bacterium]|nr:DM13 domain-containing protein [Bacteroidota bacterium]
MSKRSFFGFALVLSGCIGTDFLNSPIVPEKLIVSPTQIALMEGEQKSLSFSFTNKFGLNETANPIWIVSSPTIIAVSAEGKINGLNAGNSKIYAQVGEARDTVYVTVVNNINQVAKVEINSTTTAVSIGDQISFSGVVKTINDQTLLKTIVWKSTNENIVSIDVDGTATAISNGSATITGEVEGVVSNQVVVTVGGIRQGMFVKSGGYEASGDATLKLDGSKLVLDFASNFKTSFALGTYIYLANTNSSGATIKSSGIEIQQITRNGAHSFDVTAVNPSIKLSDYKYVIILCKPASVVFGYAELK